MGQGLLACCMGCVVWLRRSTSQISHVSVCCGTTRAKVPAEPVPFADLQEVAAPEEATAPAEEAAPLEEAVAAVTEHVLPKDGDEAT
jgi:hypothetical protein